MISSNNQLKTSSTIPRPSPLLALQSPQTLKNLLKGFLLVILSYFIFWALVLLFLYIQFLIDGQEENPLIPLFFLAIAIITFLIIYFLAKLIKIGKPKIFAIFTIVGLFIYFLVVIFYKKPSVSPKYKNIPSPTVYPSPTFHFSPSEINKEHEVAPTPSLGLTKNDDECDLNKNPEEYRVGWDQIGEVYNIWWDSSKKSLKLQSTTFCETEEFSSEDLLRITGKRDFYGVFSTLGINNSEKHLIIAVGLIYIRRLPEGGTTGDFHWVKYTVGTKELTDLPINSEKVLLVDETLFFLDVKNNDSPGSVSGYDLANDIIVLKFPMITQNSQLIPVGLSSDKKSLIFNCFTSEKEISNLTYYFGDEVSCGDYFGNLKTGKLSKVQ